MSPKNAIGWQGYRVEKGEKLNAQARLRTLRKKEKEKQAQMKPLFSEEVLAEAEVVQLQERKRTRKPSEGAAQVATVLEFPSQTDKSQIPDRSQEEPDKSQLQAESEPEKIQKKDNIKLLNGDGAGWALISAFTTIVAFIIANTVFLVSEQVSLYQSFGYSSGWAIFIATLTEAALVGLSGSASWVKGWFWKITMYAGCIATAAMVIGILDASVHERVSENIAISDQARALKKEVATAEKLEGIALAGIDSLDPKKYPTRRSQLSAKLNSPGPEGHSHRLSQLRSQLAELKNIGHADS